jgi:hypothetical protein
MLRSFIGMLMSPAAIDIILLGVLAEAGLLLAYWRRTGRGVAPRRLLANLVSGASIMAALRLSLETAVLAQSASAAIALCLALALAAHIADLAARWESGSQRSSP